jgi:hypothetical protein
MIGFWLGEQPERPAPVQGQSGQGLAARVRELEHEIQRLKLLDQALWELLREKAGMTDADLERKAHEVDMRDGVKDGRMTYTPLRCPTCGRVSSSKHWRCLYCGQEFEKPVTG